MKSELPVGWPSFVVFCRYMEYFKKLTSYPSVTYLGLQTDKVWAQSIFWPWPRFLNFPWFLLTFTLKHLQGSWPTYMHDILTFNVDLHSQTGRYGKLNLTCPCFSCETEGGRTFSVSATRLWNQLPTNLKRGNNSCFFQKGVSDIF